MNGYSDLERQLDRWLEYLKEKNLNVSDFELVKLAIELVKLDQ